MSPADPDRSRTYPIPPRAHAEVATGPNRRPSSEQPTVISQTGSRPAMRPRGPVSGPAPDLPPLPPARFATNRHGYDRAQVDQYLAEIIARLAAADERRIDATRRMAAERHRSEQLEKELREARSALQLAAAPDQPTHADSHVGFGYRAERILRLAESEAHDVRKTATAEAAALLERIQAEAEAHRHEVEKSLIARAAALDEEAGKRGAELAAREQKLAMDLEAARQEAAQLRVGARRDAEAIRRAAEEEIAKAKAAAEASASRQRSEANAELARLDGVQHGVRDDFARLHRLIVAELPADAVPAANA